MSLAQEGEDPLPDDPDTVQKTYRFVQGDCLAVMRGMPENSVDIVVTSPPYNIGIKYSDYADDKSPDEYLSWMRKISVELRRIVKDDGHVFLNVGNTNTKPYISADVAQCFRDQFELQNTFVWVKSISVGDVTTGNFKPINSDRFVNNTNENIYHFTTTGKVKLDKKAIGVPFMHKGNVERFGHTEDKRCRGNTWFVPHQPINSSSQRGGHPATFPEDIPMMCIKITGIQSGMVLDPFVGTGTTVIAAKMCGLDGTGIDLSDDYLAFAQKRLDGVEVDERKNPSPKSADTGREFAELKMGERQAAAVVIQAAVRMWAGADEPKSADEPSAEEEKKPADEPKDAGVSALPD
jgi:site-specific DNA-methyltransferase (adenine-specific)